MQSVLNNPVKLGILVLIVANVIWGASFPIYKWSLSEIPPFTFVFLRFYLGALILLPFVYKNLKVERKDWRDLILLSFFGITVAISFLILGLKLSSSINAPIILSAAPIVLIIGSFFYLKEKLKRKVVLGTGTSLLGVLIIVLLPLIEGGLDGDILGNLFFVLAAVGTVIHALLLKKILPSYQPMTIAFWSFLIGSLPLLPLYILELNQTHWLQALNFQGIVGIVYGALLATAIAHYLYAFGLKYIKASEVGIFTYVDPVATAVVALPLLHEQITIPYLVGAFFVFLGIFIAEGRLHYHPVHKLLSKI